MITEPMILYEDNHLICINKPNGSLSQGDGSRRLTMPDETKEYLKKRYNKPGNVFLGIVHRLDFTVSGALLFARTSKGASRISGQIRNHSFRKLYIALCEKNGAVSFDRWTRLTDTLVRKGNKTYRAAPSDTKGQKAELYIRLIEKRDTADLYAIELITGRKHQIRAQLSLRGIPVLGDTLYGSKSLYKDAILLHCLKLECSHPTLKTPLAITAPLQEPFLSAMKGIGEYEKIDFPQSDMIDKPQ